MIYGLIVFHDFWANMLHVFQMFSWVIRTTLTGRLPNGLHLLRHWHPADRGSVSEADRGCGAVPFWERIELPSGNGDFPW